MNKKSKVFPEAITNLPKAIIPFDGMQAFLSQADDHQIIFMEFINDLELTEHSHESQWTIVLEGKIEMTIDGMTKTYVKGDRYYIPKNVKHSGKIFSGYSEIVFFNQKDRYKANV